MKKKERSYRSSRPREEKQPSPTVRRRRNSSSSGLATGEVCGWEWVMAELGSSGVLLPSFSFLGSGDIEWLEEEDTLFAFLDLSFAHSHECP